MIHNRAMFLPRPFKRRATISLSIAALLIPAVISLSSCSGSRDGHVQASGPTVTVGVTKVVKKSLGRQLTLSSELVPFQEIDVYAKESGYVKKLMVDYGTHVKAGEVMAILEIPELEAQLQEDQAEIKNAFNQVTRARHELERYQAQFNALHLQYTRLNSVFQSQPSASKAKLDRDQSLFDYSKITAPFSGVVTERIANLGTLVQAGTSSSQAIPIVRLSEGDLFRLVLTGPDS